MTPRQALATFLELTKFPIALVSTLSTGTGYLAWSHRLEPGLLQALAGTLLLAMAALALNQLQEWRLDAKMDRTRARPIPSGRITPGAALGAALALAGAGCLQLLGLGQTPTLLGLLACAWYNGLYTPLKRHSAFAVVPGAVIGALPPALGWSAAGGRLDAPAILALGLVFFLWQVPHFWLLALLHRRSYRQAGLPTLDRHFRAAQTLRLVFTWTCATLATAGLLPALGLVRGPWGLLLQGAGSLWLFWRFLALLAPPLAPGGVRRAFLEINSFLLVIMTAVTVSALNVP